jgi:hypothetical protein
LTSRCGCGDTDAAEVQAERALLLYSLRQYDETVQACDAALRIGGD